MGERWRKIAPVLLILLAIAAVMVYLNWFAAEGNEPLKASGTVEAVEVEVAFEGSGRIAEVGVEEGQQVSAGDILVRYEDETLQAQLEQAQAALAQAQANYDLVKALPLDEERQVAIAAAEMELLNARQALQDLWDASEVARAQAQLTLAQARDALEEAEDQWDLNQPGNRAPVYRIKAARANVTLAEKRLDRAQKAFDKAHGKINKAKAQIALSDAHQAYDRAVWLLDWLEGGADEVEMGILEANLELARRNLEFAEQEYVRLQEGPDPDQLALAQARIESAEAKLALAQTNTAPQQLRLAQSQVEAAQAALKVIETQVGKLLLTAPVDGVVLYRKVEPGEAVQPGSTAVILGLLDELSITVYIPENRYGQIRLGQKATVTVDSFPGMAFEASVARIADRAEYTPRNVQTAEGRRSTVFAIELQVVDPQGRLKPGMPADVQFQDS